MSTFLLAYKTYTVRRFAYTYILIHIHTYIFIDLKGNFPTVGHKQTKILHGLSIPAINPNDIHALDSVACCLGLLFT